MDQEGFLNRDGFRMDNQKEEVNVPGWVYWKEEESARPWKHILNTTQERGEAVKRGAMFFTWTELSEPYLGNGQAEPNRKGDFPVDTDCKDDPERARDDLRKLCLVHLTKLYGIDPYAIRFFASGSKGFHAEIPAELFGAEAGDPLLPLIFKRIACDWAARFDLNTFDTSLYCMGKGKMWRIPNVKRSNGRYKVPLDLEELRDLDIDKIMRLTKNPRTIEAVDVDLQANEDLYELFRNARAAVYEELQDHKDRKPLSDEERERIASMVPDCIRYILSEFPPKTARVNFNKLVMTLGQYFHLAGYSKEAAWAKVERFVERYPHSETYHTVEKRRRHWHTIWAFLDKADDRYSFSCSFVLGLGFPGSAFECSQCKAAESATEEELSQRAKMVLDSLGNPCGEYDTAYLPPLLKRFVDQTCSTTGASPITVLSVFLTVASGFTAGSVCIPETDFTRGIEGYFQRLYPNLWTLSVSRSGSFKTTALNKGARFAFKRRSEIREKIAKAKGDYHSRLMASGLAGGNKEEQKAMEQEVARLERRDVLLPNRTTAEGLLEHLSEGFLGTILCSEFGEWLETLERSYNAGLKALFTDLFDVPAYYQYKSKGGGLLKVERPFISISGVSTLEWIEKNIQPADVSSGFFARFLIFCPPRQKQVPAPLPYWQEGLDHTVADEIWEVLEGLNTPREYGLTPQANAAFVEFHKTLYEILYSFEECIQTIIEPYVKRWSPYVLKLAMLLQPFFDKGSLEIGEKAILGAISIVEYAILSTVHLFQTELGETEAQRKQRMVLEYVARQGGRVTWGKLLMSKKLPGGKADYEYVVQTLIEAGHLIERRKEIKAKWVYELTSLKVE